MAFGIQTAFVKNRIKDIERLQFDIADTYKSAINCRKIHIWLAGLKDYFKSEYFKTVGVPVHCFVFYPYTFEIKKGDGEIESSLGRVIEEQNLEYLLCMIPSYERDKFLNLMILTILQDLKKIKVSDNVNNSVNVALVKY